MNNFFVRLLFSCIFSVKFFNFAYGFTCAITLYENSDFGGTNWSLSTNNTTSQIWTGDGNLDFQNDEVSSYKYYCGSSYICTFTFCTNHDCSGGNKFNESCTPGGNGTEDQIIYNDALTDIDVLISATDAPTSLPTNLPSSDPTSLPTSFPTVLPTAGPTSEYTCAITLYEDSDFGGTTWSLSTDNITSEIWTGDGNLDFSNDEVSSYKYYCGNGYRCIFIFCEVHDCSGGWIFNESCTPGGDGNDSQIIYNDELTDIDVLISATDAPTSLPTMLPTSLPTFLPTAGPTISLNASEYTCAITLYEDIDFGGTTWSLSTNNRTSEIWTGDGNLDFQKDEVSSYKYYCGSGYRCIFTFCEDHDCSGGWIFNESCTPGGNGSEDQIIYNDELTDIYVSISGTDSPTSLPTNLPSSDPTISPTTTYMVSSTTEGMSTSNADTDSDSNARSRSHVSIYLLPLLTLVTAPFIISNV